MLFLLSWRLAPVLATVIIFTGIAAATYRKVTRTIEARQSNSILSMTRVASQAFLNIRTVRAFAGVLPVQRNLSVLAETLVRGSEVFKAEISLRSLRKFLFLLLKKKIGSKYTKMKKTSLVRGPGKVFTCIIKYSICRMKGTQKYFFFFLKPKPLLLNACVCETP